MYLTQRLQGSQVCINGSSENLALVSRQRKSQSLWVEEESLWYPSRRCLSLEWSEAMAVSTCVPKEECFPGEWKVKPKPLLVTRDLWASHFGLEKMLQWLAFQLSDSSRMICSFVYKEKCQASEKIPRTMIVTHDKIEHVKFFWRLGLDCWCRTLWGFYFSPLRKLWFFFINNTGFKKWNFMALLGQFKGILIWDQYSKEPHLL